MDVENRTTDPVVTAVMEDLNRRSLIGIEKYGTNLARTDLSLADWLVHAYEESLDHALYLRRTIGDIRGEKWVTLDLSYQNIDVND